MDAILDFIRENDFNVIRLPFSLEAALNLDVMPGFTPFDTYLRGKTVRQIVEVRATVALLHTR